LQLGHRFSEDLIQSVAFELGSSYFLKTSYLSADQLEINFIRNLVEDPALKKRTLLMQNYMTCIVPLINTIRPTDLIKLRETEGDSFLLFRQAFTKAIEEYKTQGELFTENDARALYYDVIQPRLANISITINNANKLFSRINKGKILGLMATLGVGYSVSLIDSKIIETAIAAGILKLSEYIESLIKNAKQKDQIQNDPMYFLWKATQMADSPHSK